MALSSTQFSDFHPVSEPLWRQMASVSDYRVPAQLRPWLSDTGSLTQRLMDACDNRLKVQVLRQNLGVPRLSERRALKLPQRRLALIREVLLLGGGTAWVYARSIIPLSTLTGRLRSLRQLDNRPLGALLFSEPSMCREPVEVACFNSPTSQMPAVLAAYQPPMWARRSVFRLDHKPLLVSEIFLPSFSPYNQCLSFDDSRSV
ncbi:chorismate lyase [Porticoccaceae bacterium]|nr:chorismate lyase [Porticoccaceae bacterium]